jgi:hypothetical protein
MDEDAKKARAEYYRKWREKNREKIRIYNQNYWKKRSKMENK